MSNERYSLILSLLLHLIVFSLCNLYIILLFVRTSVSVFKRYNAISYGLRYTFNELLDNKFFVQTRLNNLKAIFKTNKKRKIDAGLISLSHIEIYKTILSQNLRIYLENA